MKCLLWMTILTSEKKQRFKAGIYPTSGVGLVLLLFIVEIGKIGI